MFEVQKAAKKKQGGGKGLTLKLLSAFLTHYHLSLPLSAAPFNNSNTEEEYSH